ncbi:MAG: hypothetical protein ABI831_15120 [Betaproteobacteria bacterium]
MNTPIWQGRWGCAVIAVTAFMLSIALDAAAADSAKGALTYKSKGAPVTITLKYVWLVKGPDAIDPKKMVRHLILSSADIGSKVTACKTMSCTDADLGSGMTVDLDAGPRLNYWVVLDDQRVQYSGTAKPESLKLTADTPARLAGKLTIDDTAAGGAKVDVEFDASMLPELKRAR